MMMGALLPAVAHAEPASDCGTNSILSDWIDEIHSLRSGPYDMWLASYLEVYEPPTAAETLEIAEVPQTEDVAEDGGSGSSLSPEEQAALATIRYAEGADYDRLFGWFENKSRVFDPDTQVGHPRSTYTSRGGHYTSSAAGAYQAMPNTWAEEVGKGTITNDFTPDNQDKFALARLKFRGLLDEVQAGDTSWIDSSEMGREWASFPNSPYGQPSHSSSNLRSYYFEKLREYQEQE